MGATSVSSSETLVSQPLTVSSPLVFAQTVITQQKMMQAANTPRIAQSQPRRFFPGSTTGADGVCHPLPSGWPAD